MRVLGYWWRQRGRFWRGWHQALAKLQKTGLTASSVALQAVFNEEQSKIVWDAAAEAAADLVRLAPKASPQNFTDAQTKLDASVMFRRFIVKDLGSKIPPRLKKQDTVLKSPAEQAATRIKPLPKPELPKKIPPGLVPTPPVPRLPRIGGLGWLLLAAVVLSRGDD